MFLKANKWKIKKYISVMELTKELKSSTVKELLLGWFWIFKTFQAEKLGFYFSHWTKQANIIMNFETMQILNLIATLKNSFLCPHYNKKGCSC